MPSIAYIESEEPRDDPSKDGQTDHRAVTGMNSKPEPPSRFDPGAPRFMGSPGEPPRNSHGSEFDGVRRLVTIAQVMAVISLVIGGVILSGASAFAAISAYRRAQAGLLSHDGESLPWKSLRRSATMALVMAFLALALNVVALVVIYPLVMDALQSGEYDTLFSGLPQGMAPSSGSSTWG